MILHDNILDGPQYIFLYKNEFHKIFFIRPFSQAKAIAKCPHIVYFYKKNQ